MKILVAGGAGYIGSAVVPKLIERGYVVDVVDLLWFGVHLPDGVNIVRKDVFDLKQEDLAGYQVVVFLAGLSNDPMAEFAPSMNFIYNAAAPAYLAYIAKMAKVKRFVYAGSCSVYGYTVNELYDETAPAISMYPYGISKLQGEKAVLQLTDETFSTICFRQGTVSGYSPRMRLDLIVNTMFKTSLETGEIIVNNPAIWRPILSIEDACSAYVQAIEASEGISGIFNIASGNYTVGETADIVKSVLENSLGLKIKLNINHKQDVRNYKVNCDKAMNMLNIQPVNDVASIVGHLIKHRGSFSDLSNPLYYNIKIFQGLRKYTHD